MPLSKVDRCNMLNSLQTPSFVMHELQSIDKRKGKGKRKESNRNSLVMINFSSKLFIEDVESISGDLT